MLGAETGGTGSRSPEQPRLKVVYILGHGRSGSTLLGNVLGEAKGFFHAGELRTLWGLGLQHGRRCGCGLPVRECPFWRAVLERVEPILDDEKVDAGDVAEWHRANLRGRRTISLLRHARGKAGASNGLDSYMRITESLYLAVGDVSRARVIVDCSKRPQDGALLGSLPGLDPYFVHLVRDPRAVAYSWQRHKHSPGEGTREQMLITSPATSSRNWMWVNAASELITRTRGRGKSILVRYEDFVSDPRTTIRRVADLVGEDVVGTPVTGEGTVLLGENHTAGGNPGRFAGGEVHLRLDDEWITSQRAAHKAISTVLTAPLLPAYRYSLLPLGRRRSSRA